MKPLKIGISVLVFLFSCQPYGRVPVRSCDENSSTYDSRKENLKLLETDPDLLNIYNLFAKLKVINVDKYTKEIIRLVDLILAGEILNKRSDIENVSPLFKSVDHSLESDTDYLGLLAVLHDLSTKKEYETLISQGASIYVQSIATKQPTVGSCCTPECIERAELFLEAILQDNSR
jgi:hypothetical protein